MVTPFALEWGNGLVYHWFHLTVDGVVLAPPGFEINSLQKASGLA